MTGVERTVTAGERHRRFVVAVNGYPPDAQEVISSVSSMMLEPDVAANFRRNNGEIVGFMGQLRTSGLRQEQISYVLGHFGLPDPTARKTK